MNKPPILYHASHNTELIVLEPRNTAPRFDGEGDLVFATPSLAVAAMFLAPKGDCRQEIGVYGDCNIMIINCTPEEFIKWDKGGAIYELPVDTFTTDDKIGMRETEWVSKEAVKPLKKRVYSSSRVAMAEAGAELFFVDDETFNAIQGSADHGFSIINRLKPYSNHIG